MAHIIFIDSTATGLNAFATARRLGHEVTLVRATEATSFIDLMLKDPARLAQQLRHVDHQVSVRTFEPADLLPALDELAARVPIDAVVSTAETGIMPAALAAEHFGTRYPSPSALGNAVFKDRCRALLQAAGLRSPRFEVLDEDQLTAGPRDIRLPFVVKPVRGFAKQYSAICRTAEEFDAYARDLQASRLRSASIDRVVARRYIVEEYVVGTLHSAEVVVRDGQVMTFATTTRYRAHYYDLLELAAAMPSGLPAADRAAIGNYLQQVFTCIGIGIGLYHVELLLSAEGPVLVEINARMMGSVSPVMYQRLTGLDPFEHLVRLHLGEPLTLADDGFHGAAMTLAVAARHGGRVRDDFDPAALARLLASYGIAFDTLAIAPGREVARYEGNLSIMGHVIVDDVDPVAVAAKAHRFLGEMDALLGLETAKYSG